MHSFAQVAMAPEERLMNSWAQVARAPQFWGVRNIFPVAFSSLAHASQMFFAKCNTLMLSRCFAERRWIGGDRGPFFLSLVVRTLISLLVL